MSKIYDEIQKLSWAQRPVTILERAFEIYSRSLDEFKRQVTPPDYSYPGMPPFIPKKNHELFTTTNTATSNQLTNEQTKEVADFVVELFKRIGLDKAYHVKKSMNSGHEVKDYYEIYITKETK